MVSLAGGRCSSVVVLMLMGFLVAGAATVARAQTQKIVGIEVKGNKNISAEAVLLAITRCKVGDDLSDQHVAEDERAIRRLGFFHDVRSQVESVAGGAKLTFAVVENPKVTAIQISGNTRVPTPQLEAGLQTKVGSVFKEDAFEKDVASVQKAYKEKGLVLARVTEESGVSPEGVVKIAIAEGWVEAIKVVGCRKTKQYVVLREVETKPGEVFDTNKLNDDRKRLHNLDYFELPTPEFQLEDGSEPGKVVLVINCKEKKTGTVSIGLGYSSRDRLVGFADVSEHNFRGVGQQVGVRWEAGQYTNRTGYELSFADPWLLGKRTSLGLQLYNRTTNRPLVLGGDQADTWIFERRRGAGVSVGKPLGRFDRLLLDFRSDDIKFSPVEGYPAPPTDMIASEGRVTSLTFRGIRNTRDYDINPHRGSLHSASAELAGGPLGGRWTFTKLGTDLRHYLPVGKAKADGANQMVLAMRVMGGISLGNVPLSENYWIGGAETLRGYREDEFHGTRMLLFSSEFRVPFGSSLQGVTFFDYGYAWPEGQGLRLADMQPAVGLGLRVVTPLGPLRLDYGFGKQGGRSHFSIGHVF